MAGALHPYDQHVIYRIATGVSSQETAASNRSCDDVAEAVEVNIIHPLRCVEDMRHDLCRDAKHSRLGPFGALSMLETNCVREVECVHIYEEIILVLS